jgi:hypothetical protein
MSLSKQIKTESQETNVNSVSSQPMKAKQEVTINQMFKLFSLLDQFTQLESISLRFSMKENQLICSDALNELRALNVFSKIKELKINNRLLIDNFKPQFRRQSMNVLNEDCLGLVLSHLPLSDKFRLERVNKKWKKKIFMYVNQLKIRYENINSKIVFSVGEDLMMKIGDQESEIELPKKNQHILDQIMTRAWASIRHDG